VQILSEVSVARSLINSAAVAPVASSVASLVLHVVRKAQEGLKVEISGVSVSSTSVLFTFMYSVGRHGTNGSHLRSLVVVGACASNSRGVQTVTGAHCASVVFVAGDTSNQSSVELHIVLSLHLGASASDVAHTSPDSWYWVSLQYP
jgi:hypothetical protein